MKAVLLGVLGLLVWSLGALEPCEPFGLRLNYGRSVLSAGDPERLALRFNTREECPWVEMLLKGFMVVHCEVRGVAHRLVDHAVTRQLYRTHVHRCSLMRQLDFDTDIEYNLIDLRTSKKLFSSPFKINVKNPHNASQHFRILNLADWGPLTGQAAQEQQSISSSLQQLVAARQVDCVLINGDVGYELNSDAAHHEATMALLSEVAARVPLVLNRGNHEDYSPDSTVAEMFNDYFELYDLHLHNATGITLGPLLLAIVDPTNLLLPRLYPRFTHDSLHSSWQAIQPFLERAQREGRTIVGVSHYPLVCGFPTKGHCLPDTDYGEVQPLYVNLRDFYTLFLKHGAPLVLSAHIHIYERTFPFTAGYRSTARSQDSYSSAEGFIHVVEGVCGSNNGLEPPSADYEPPAFVASHSEGKNGFGLLHASAERLAYQHFTVSGGEAKLFDSFTIELPAQKEKEPTDTEL